jgi:FkbM family methyltransferase
MYEDMGISSTDLVWIDTSDSTLSESGIDAFFERKCLDPSKYSFWNVDIQESERILKEAKCIQYAKAIYLKISTTKHDPLEEIDQGLSTLHFKRVSTYLSMDSGEALYVKEIPVKDNPLETYTTPYGLITLYKNEVYIGKDFKAGGYWDIDTLTKLKKYIDPNRNILEIGGHCGTSSIVYASYLKDAKLYVYEPQRNMYTLLVQNINQNHLQDKIIPPPMGVFCYQGDGIMNDIDLDGGEGIVEKRYTEESNLDCNFGGIGLGKGGEKISLTTIDHMNLENVGFIHCDAQGAENFILSKGIETIRKNRPVILFENNYLFGRYLYDNVCKSYSEYKEESLFDITKYCMEELKYSTYIHQFNGGSDTLLLPL